ncbi:MAG: group II intron reverse transcriptase/maturase, partial [Sphingobacteriaceae bacterium]
MSSGSYFPPAVRGVAIPKKTGGTRILGIPTVSDRIAQSVVKSILEPLVEPIFHKDSYGYRPNKCAHDAIEITRKRCWIYPWVVEFDIKGLFDNINHDLMMKAVMQHCQIPWILLYIKRWLTAPLIQVGQVTNDQTIMVRDKGTPQGGVISPVLANLFMHYVFDCWMRKYYAHIEWCRYADDGLVHCKTKRDAYHLLEILHQRFKQCHLELHT